jgi:hypothetical protein
MTPCRQIFFVPSAFLPLKRNSTKKKHVEIRGGKIKESGSKGSGMKARKSRRVEIMSLMPRE